MANIGEIRGDDAKIYVRGYKKDSWVEGHYKRVETNLKRRKYPIHFEYQPKSIEEIIFRLIFKAEATYCHNKPHCRKGAFRSAQDFYHLIHYYILRVKSVPLLAGNKKQLFTYKGCSELLQFMVRSKLLNVQYCDTVKKEVYIPQSVRTDEEKIKEYVEKYFEQ